MGTLYLTHEGEDQESIVKIEKNQSRWHSEPCKINQLGKETLLPCQQIIQRLFSMKRNLKTLQELTHLCSASTVSEDEKEAFQLMIDTLAKDINSLFDLIATLREGAAIPSESLPSRDISVAFFGLDWNNSFKLLDKFAKCMDEMRSEPTSSLWTLVLPQHLLHDLLQLESDLEAHQEAVLKGRTNREEKEHIRSEQRRMSLQPIRAQCKGNRRFSLNQEASSSSSKGFFASLMSLVVRKRGSERKGSKNRFLEEESHCSYLQQSDHSR